MTKEKTAVRPIQKSERIVLLDIFRGFAIFGIFMVNLLFMTSAFSFRFEYEAEFSEGINEVILEIYNIFFHGKFFTIFSFLFGVGITLQFMKRNHRFLAQFPFYFRRFVILFILGMMHIVFIWSGDILHLYALLGFIVIAMINRSNLVIFITAFLVIVFPFYEPVMTFLSETFPLNLTHPLADYSRDQIIEIYREGTYVDLVKMRWSEYDFLNEILYAFMAPQALSMMLLGVYAVKKKIFANMNAFIARRKYHLLIAGILAFSYHSFINYYMMPTYGREIDPYLGYVLTKLFFISNMVAALFYLFVIAVLFQKNFWRRVLSPFQYVGRMALSNYIFQSVVGFFIFTSYGFALYESMSPLWITIIAMLVFAVQIVLSKIWLQYYRFGPLEWLWRCGSYMQWIPIKKRDED